MNIIEIAKEAGFDIDEGLFPFEASEDKFIGTERTLERFAALVRAEYEAPLKLAENTLRDIIRVYKFEGGTPVTALAAIREALAEQSKCACDSPAWCTKYKKCNREVLGLPKAQPVKQEPVAWMWQSVDIESRSIETGLLFNRGADDENTDWTPLYAATVSAEAIRADEQIKALEAARTIGGDWAAKFEQEYLK